MNKYTFSIGVGALIVIILLFVGIRGFQQASANSGTIVLSFSNSQELAEAISSATLHIDRIELWSDDRGWEKLEDQELSFNLGELQEHKQAVLALETRVPAYQYDRIRVGVSELTLETTEGTTTQAFLLTNLTSFDGAFVIRPKETTSIQLDLQADYSIRTTTNNDYVFIPVVKLESRSGTTITVDDKNFVTAEGGTIDINQTYGTDATGATRKNYRIPNSVQFVENNGSISLIEPKIDPLFEVPEPRVEKEPVLESTSTEPTEDLDLEF